MRVLLLTALLLGACLPEDEASISQSSNVTGNSLTNSSSSNYIKEGECLVNIKGVLGLNTNTSLLPLASQQCLPSSKLSWLFRAEEVRKDPQWLLPHLKLAILFDTSYSLQEQDSGADRFNKLKTYLANIFARKSQNGISTTENSGQIASADIRIFPFKYCDQTKGNAHQLSIKQDTKQSEFMAEVDALIGFTDKHGNSLEIDGNKLVIEDQRRTNLKSYGAGGSTNYLESLAWATDFLDTESGDSTLKHVVIISDGLPFTYGTTILNDSCSLSTVDAGNRHSFGSARARSCVTTTHSPSKNSCVAPSGSDKGLTDGMKAFDDPRNHLLGMIQHSIVINGAKSKKGFKVYAVHLNNCRDQTDSTTFSELHLCQKISQPFFESFTTRTTKRAKTGGEIEISSGYFPANDIGALDDALQGVLDNQLPADPIAYVSTGRAYIDAPSSKNSSQLEVDKQTELYTGNRIKVGRDKGDSSADGVHDYRDYGKQRLTVEHGLQGRGGNFGIDYDFQFAPLISAAGKGGVDVVNVDACRSQGSDFFKLGTKNLEVNKYQGDNYEVWCLLPPRCNEDNQCCEDHREITAAEGAQRCANEGQNLQWSGFPVCGCICNQDSKAACTGKNQIWSDTECACVPTTIQTQQDCDATKYCCEGDQPVTSCPTGQKLQSSPPCCVAETTPPSPPPTSTCSKTCRSPLKLDRANCICVCDLSQLRCNTPKEKSRSSCSCVCPTSLKQACAGTFNATTCECTVTTPTQNTDPNQRPENPERNGGVQGNEGYTIEPPATEGIVWGKYEFF